MDTNITLTDWVDSEIEKAKREISVTDEANTLHLRRMVEIQSSLREREARIKAIELEAQVRCQLIRQESDARIDAIRAETWRKY